MWTSPQFTNVEPGDEQMAVWHLPYEKKRGLFRLFDTLSHDGGIRHEDAFWQRAQKVTGVPVISLGKRFCDRLITLRQKL